MAKNGLKGGGLQGAIKGRSQTRTPAGNPIKRNTRDGRFMDVKTSDQKPFRGIRKEK